jgi:hypothetical protein
MEHEVRAAGFQGPLACIPHGAWISSVHGMSYRHRLGLDERVPLIGVFGFLKPYKRISQSLRAFRRLVRVEPLAKMILVGEPHPDFPVHSLIKALGLGQHRAHRGTVRLEFVRPYRTILGRERQKFCGAFLGYG